MWYMVPKRRRKRSGHRQTLQVAPVPIIFSRLPGALSTRSLDVSERQNPGFFMRSEFASLQWFCSFRNSLCPVGKVGGGRLSGKTADLGIGGTSALPRWRGYPSSGSSPQSLALSLHFSLKSTGNVRKIGVSSCGRGFSSLVLRWKQTVTPFSARAFLRPAITHYCWDWSELELIHLSVF